MNVNDGEHLLKARTLQGRIRFRCLKGFFPSFPCSDILVANAALVFCSIGNSGAAPNPSVNLDTIRNLWVEMLSLDASPQSSLLLTEVKEGMTDLIVPLGADSEALITAATGFQGTDLSSFDENHKEWKEWLQRRENNLKESPQITADLKDASVTPLLRMVREAEEEEDQWLQSLREALGTSPDGEYNNESTSTTSSSTVTPSILDTLAAAPSQKPVSRRASSHVSESSTTTSQIGSKLAVSSSLSKKRSSVMSHSASSSSLTPPAEGKPSTTSGNGKEVKSFFENFLTPGPPGSSSGGGSAGSSSGTQKK